MTSQLCLELNTITTLTDADAFVVGAAVAENDARLVAEARRLVARRLALAFRHALVVLARAAAPLRAARVQHHHQRQQ